MNSGTVGLNNAGVIDGNDDGVETWDRAQIRNTGTIIGQNGWGNLLQRRARSGA